MCCENCKTENCVNRTIDPRVCCDKCPSFLRTTCPQFRSAHQDEAEPTAEVVRDFPPRQDAYTEAPNAYTRSPMARTGNFPPEVDFCVVCDPPRPRDPYDRFGLYVGRRWICGHCVKTIGVHAARTGVDMFRENVSTVKEVIQGMRAGRQQKQAHPPAKRKR
jgi:hypothetical protein